uniref:DNA modification methylase n=1 Tax=Pseudomonas phage Touem01 TaxID=3138548 RepID=A0AAU6W266_9VIRU
MTDMSRMMGLNVDIPQIKLVAIEHLVAFENNSRTHSPAQVEQIKASLLKWGWTNPVLADELGTVAGHGRTMAANELYREGKQIKFPGGVAIPIGMVPVIDCTGWSVAERRAYVIADNKLALNAGWDVDLLSLELTELAAADFDLGLTGFSEDELSDLLLPPVDEPPDTDPDEAPPLPEVPVSVEGDVWVLGPHRVCCGDSTSLDDWDRLMAGERADICWTDPPYNVDVGRKNRLLDTVDGLDRSATGSIKNDKMSDSDFAEFMAEIYASVLVQLKPGAPIYVAHADRTGDVFRNAFTAAGFHFSQTLIWKKNNIALGVSDYQNLHEPILYGWRPGSRHKWHGGRKNKTVIEVGEGGPISRMSDGRWCIKVGDQVLVVDGAATLEESPSSVIFEPKPAKSELHPTQKPVALVERMLSNSARSGDLVVDAFGGSGTTLLAADRLGMSARLMELDPKFVDVIVTRWQDYIGRRATHASTGELFPGDNEERTPPPVPSADDEDVF